MPLLCQAPRSQGARRHWQCPGGRRECQPLKYGAVCAKVVGRTASREGRVTQAQGPSSSYHDGGVVVPQGHPITLTLEESGVQEVGEGVRLSNGSGFPAGVMTVF